MDELRSKRMQRVGHRLPSEDEILTMFERNLWVRFQVSPERDSLALARRRIRAAAARFGRTVETTYHRASETIVGVVPLTDEETRWEQENFATRIGIRRKLAANNPPKPPRKKNR